MAAVTWLCLKSLMNKLLINLHNPVTMKSMIPKQGLTFKQINRRMAEKSLNAAFLGANIGGDGSNLRRDNSSWSFSFKVDNCDSA